MTSFFAIGAKRRGRKADFATTWKGRLKSIFFKGSQYRRAAADPNRNPAQRLRFGSEEIPCPAKKPRRKAGIRAKQGISELAPWTGFEPAAFRLGVRPSLLIAS